jgi:hypothetical protein
MKEMVGRTIRRRANGMIFCSSFVLISRNPDPRPRVNSSGDTFFSMSEIARAQPLADGWPVGAAARLELEGWGWSDIGRTRVAKSSSGWCQPRWVREDERTRVAPMGRPSIRSSMVACVDMAINWYETGTESIAEIEPVQKLIE